MKQLFDFIPAILFFVSYKLYGVIIATEVLIVSTLIMVLAVWLIYRKIDKMMLITAAFVGVFGSLTIYLDDNRFIIWKVICIHTLFMLLLLLTPLFIKQTLLQRMLGENMTLPGKVWSRLNLIWTAFFALMALTTFYIGFYISFDAFMNFKTFVFPALSLILVLVSAGYIYRYLPNDEKQPNHKNNSDDHSSE